MQKIAEKKLTELNLQRNLYYKRKYKYKCNCSFKLNEIWLFERKTLFKVWIFEKTFCILW